MEKQLGTYQSAVHQALFDSTFADSITLETDPDEINILPMETASYTVTKSNKNCGSVCGCDASKGVGCEGANGENDKGSDCPNKVG